MRGHVVPHVTLQFQREHNLTPRIAVPVAVACTTADLAAAAAGCYFVANCAHSLTCFSRGLTFAHAVLPNTSLFGPTSFTLSGFVNSSDCCQQNTTSVAGVHPIIHHTTLLLASDLLLRELKFFATPPCVADAPLEVHQCPSQIQLDSLQLSRAPLACLGFWGKSRPL